MIASELLPGQFFIYKVDTKQNYARCYRIIHEDWSDNNTVPCINVDQPEALWAIMSNTEVFV